MKSTFFHLQKSILLNSNTFCKRFHLINSKIHTLNNESSSKPDIIQILQKKVEEIDIIENTSTTDDITTTIKPNHKRKSNNKLKKSKYINFSNLPDSVLPRVALIGRPNVGKSALFNKLSKTPKAIVYDTPGRSIIMSNLLHHNFKL